MPIVLISNTPHGVGQDLAEKLAQKTGWPLFSRDELAEQAHDHGIKLSRLETFIVKSSVVPEKMAREKELYLAYVTVKLCEKAQGNNLIYYGRAGHLFLPGVSHRLRVGLGVPLEIRIKKVMNDLRLSQEKALEYLEKIDDDIDKWVRFVHRENPSDPEHFDIFFNLKNISLANASMLLCETAGLPDFRPSPESLNRLNDLHLAARAKLRLAKDEHTCDLDLSVRAVGGVVTVTYMPRQEAAAQSISGVLQDMEGCRKNLCTMAETNILWIQEAFNPRSESFKQINRLAQRWGAAIELLRLIPHRDEIHEASPVDSGPNAPLSENAKDHVYDGGVEDDEIETAADDDGVSETQEALAAAGRSAGGLTIFGGNSDIIAAVKESRHYSLVVLGDLFLSKGPETRKRQTRELGVTIRDRLKAAVITADELESRFLFGKKQAVKLLLYAVAVFCIYGLVFQFQSPIVNFFGGTLKPQWKWLASFGIAIFVPLVAYLYSTVAGLIFKLIDID